MQESSRSMITLANVICDVVNRRATPKTVRKIVERITKLWVASPAADAGEAADMMANTLNKAEEAIFCLGPPLTVDVPVSRVTDQGTLTEFFIYKAAFGMLLKPHVPRTMRPIRKLKPAQIRRNAMMRGKRPVAWITTTAVIDDLEKKTTAASGDLASTVRDHLGLDYLGAGEEIIEIQYPKDALTGSRVAAPTFVEGACRNVYRSHTKKREWGTAVDLDSLGGGAPEAVHSPIRLTSEFTFRYLGRVTFTRIFVDDILETRCPRRWKNADVKTLGAYVK